jgi:hypothetical protein
MSRRTRGGCTLGLEKCASPGEYGEHRDKSGLCKPPACAEPSPAEAKVYQRNGGVGPFPAPLGGLTNQPRGSRKRAWKMTICFETRARAGSATGGMANLDLFLKSNCAQAPYFHNTARASAPLDPVLWVWRVCWRQRRGDKCVFLGRGGAAPLSPTTRYWVDSRGTIFKTIFSVRRNTVSGKVRPTRESVSKR